MSEVEAATNIARWMLQPIQSLLGHPGLTDLHINGPGEGQAFVDTGGGMRQITLPYTLRDLEDLALYAAAITRQDISEATPLVSTKFPDGERVQIAMPPAVADGRIAFSIRKPKAMSGTPDDLERSGVFAKTMRAGTRTPPHEADLLRMFKLGDYKEFLMHAVHSGLNIVFSGKVGSGKTHNLRAFANCIPADNRIVTIEDMPEIVGMAQPNVVNFFYSKGGQSIAKVQPEDLVEAALRTGMDWLLNQELRDQAAYSWLHVVESGHSSLSTTHAQSAAQTRDRIRGLVKKHPAGMHMKDEEVMASLYRSIDVVAYCERHGDQRYIAEVLYDPELRDRYASVPSPFKAKDYA